MKLSVIEAHLKSLEGDALREAVTLYEQDERKGVQKLCAQSLKRLKNQALLEEQWADKLLFDAVFHKGEQVFVGVDEVGRGPLAGPVVAAAVILPYDAQLLGLKDSKKLSEEKREALYDSIYEQALAVGVGIVEAQVIDEINILQATFQAMREAIQALGCTWDVLCVDGDKTIPQLEGVQHAVIKGDDKSAAIAAASVVAKVTRDRMMKEWSKTYPQYDWESNKGYGSAKHYDGIRLHGMTPLHRTTFLKGVNTHV